MDDELTTLDKCLTDEEKTLLSLQDKRLVKAHKAQELELQAQKYWDLFYKRNETRFFRDRRWTTREFEELLGNQQSAENNKTSKSKKYLLEVGCGVGNFVYPLVEEEMKKETPDYFYYVCDFSPRAVDFVRLHSLYNEKYIKAFQCDVTTAQLHEHLEPETLDIVTMIFVFSAIHPDKFRAVLKNLWKLLKPGGVVLFRDYGLYDMAQLRFKPGHKICENLYMRQDGTRSYYFSETELKSLFVECGFDVISNAYVHRRTRNVKESIDVARIFLQGKFIKRVES